MCLCTKIEGVLYLPKEKPRVQCVSGYKSGTLRYFFLLMSNKVKQNAIYFNQMLRAAKVVRKSNLLSSFIYLSFESVYVDNNILTYIDYSTDLSRPSQQKRL